MMISCWFVFLFWGVFLCSNYGLITEILWVLGTGEALTVWGCRGSTLCGVRPEADRYWTQILPASSSGPTAGHSCASGKMYLRKGKMRKNNVRSSSDSSHTWSQGISHDNSVSKLQQCCKKIEAQQSPYGSRGKTTLQVEKLCPMILFLPHLDQLYSFLIPFSPSLNFPPDRV